MMTRSIPARVFLTLILMVAAGCSGTPHQPENVSETFLAMGGIPVEIVANGISRQSLNQYVSTVKSSVAKWESELSFFNPFSVVNTFAQSPGQPILLEPHLFEAFQDAATAFAISDGAFDITVGPIIHLWKDAGKTGVEPTAEAIADAVSRTGFNHLRIDPANRTILLDQPGLAIDFGGIAKGLMAQWIAERIRDDAARNDTERLKKLLVNPGGDMYCLTPDPDAVCTVGIQNPFGAGVWGEIKVRDRAIVTSGTYQRFFEIGGKQYCHIVDPRTGRPIDTNLRSVTVLDPSGAMADAIATACFVLGEPACWEMAAKRPETAILVIRADQTWKASESLEGRVTVF